MGGYTATPATRFNVGDFVRYRVIVWGTGFVGKSVLRDLLDHPNFEIVVAIRFTRGCARRQLEICGQSVCRLCLTPYPPTRISTHSRSGWRDQKLPKYLIGKRILETRITLPT